MMVETLMSMAAPWPLKVIIDNVAGSQHLPGVVLRLLTFMPLASDKFRTPDIPPESLGNSANCEDMVRTKTCPLFVIANV
jgi:hypothetical protein